MNDAKAIEEGLALFESLLRINPEDAVSHYNLGNGLIAFADQQPYKSFDWYLITAEASLLRCLGQDRCCNQRMLSSARFRESVLFESVVPSKEKSASRMAPSAPRRS